MKKQYKKPEFSPLQKCYQLTGGTLPNFVILSVFPGQFGISCVNLKTGETWIPKLTLDLFKKLEFVTRKDDEKG